MFGTKSLQIASVAPRTTTLLIRGMAKKAKGNPNTVAVKLLKEEFWRGAAGDTFACK